jgi:outer membrane protein assembly factor BamB
MTPNIFIGIGGHVVALRPEDGTEVWRTKLGSGQFCAVAELDGRLYAGVNGQVWCLDPATGAVLWPNKLKRLGMGYVTFAAGGTGALAAARGAAAVRAAVIASGG